MDNSYEFQKKVKEKIIKYEKENHGRDLTIENISVVFQAYTLGNHKGTFIVNCGTDFRYYEATYNKCANKIYLDVYRKEANIVLDI